MPRITNMEELHSIKVGISSTVAPDGTIIDPEPYIAVEIAFDDGTRIQVERPLTIAKVQQAYKDALTNTNIAIDGIAIGAVIP